MKILIIVVLIFHIKYKNYLACGKCIYFFKHNRYIIFI